MLAVLLSLSLHAAPATGLTPEKAAAAMTVPEGFNVTLFAGEPDVHQPVAFCFDDRGRLWVVEAFTYPQRHPHPGPLLPEKEKAKGDKVLIFEDTDGDGKFDKRTVFIEGLNLVSGIEYGFGGIYIGAAPYFMHIPVKDDKPAGLPVILLDGWGYQDTHETLNSFIWGPDGWLYGCHGVFTHSKVGKPGTPDKDRTKINAGYWRFHPTRKVFEVFAEGTSNPWGLDYNQYGDFFASCCVIPHLFHIVQGGRYIRQAGQHFNPHTYLEIPTIADHRHYVGNQWNNDDRSKSSDFGGGHAHCGLMCYQGGAWPKEYHGQLFMGNIHGQRINMDIPKPKGSTYVASHGKDFLLANDKWARFIAMKYGPDGNMYVIDWYDAQACHRQEKEIWDRTNGRIYKVSYRGTKPVVGLDLQKCTDEELTKHLSNENEWYVQRAKRILQERYSQGLDAAQRFKQLEKSGKADPTKVLRTELVKEAVNNPSERVRLRMNWALNNIEQAETAHYEYGQANPSKFNETMRSMDSSPHVRAWLWKQYYEDPTGFKIHAQNANELEQFLQSETDPAVLLTFASVAQRYSPEHAMDFVSALTKHKLPADDPLTEIMMWYAMEHACADSPSVVLLDAAETGKPTLVQLTARRMVTHRDFIERNQDTVHSMKHFSTQMQTACLRGVRDGLKQSRNLKLASEWTESLKQHHKSSDPNLSKVAFEMLVLLRDPSAMEVLRKSVPNETLTASTRLEAFQSLLEAKDASLKQMQSSLLKDAVLRAAAIRAMATIGDATAPKMLLESYSTFGVSEKRDVVTVLATKPAFATALLDALAAKTIPMSDVPAETIRQLRSFKNKDLDAKIAAVWGTFRDTPAERKKFIAAWKSKLALTHTPDLAAGRAVFAKTCAQCHALYGSGGNVGPEITGANRSDINYLLENIFDPSAVIPKEYAATTFDLADGRKVTGIVKQDGPQITLQTATEVLKFDAADVEKRQASELSMMPDDLTKPLNEVDVKNLFAYLKHPQQVAMKATAENAKEFFNGKDLANWDGDKEVWSVVDGAIVGKSTAGLKKNTFLTSALEVSDFKLTLKTKLTPNAANSGIQFRSVRIDGGEMRGPQADMGAGWWGKLYEESGRGLLVKEGGEAHVKPGEWNDYAIEARGPSVKMWINGKLVADYSDDKLAKKGLIGLQVHSGGPTEVQFKDLKLEVLP